MSEALLEAVQQLRKEAAEGKAPTRYPSRLRVGAIRTAPAAFQVRADTAEGVTSDAHVEALRRALEAMPDGEQEFDPLTVFAVGEQPYCIDGHHRLAAYRAAGIDGRIPVQWFRGSLEEALLEAARANQKVKLPMSPEQRMNAAWRFTCLGVKEHSLRHVAAATGVSKRQVGIMRALRRSYAKLFPDQPLPGYRQAVEDVRTGTPGDGEIYSEAWEEQKITWFVSAIQQHLGDQGAQHPELFAAALQRYGGGRLIDAIATAIRAAEGLDLDDDDVQF